MKYLVIGPGGMGIFGYLGYLKKIETKLDKVEGYSGASAGSILVICLAFGKTIDEILNFLLELDPNRLSKINLKRFMNSYGFISTDLFKEKLIEFIGGDYKFKDVEKDLYISSFCVNRGNTEYFSKYNYPDMSILDAMCMSVSIPFLFETIKFNEMNYIDGGTMETLPLLPFIDKEDTFCLKINDNRVPQLEINSVRDYASILFRSLMKNRQSYHVKELVSIDLSEYNIFDLRMKYDDKLKMFFNIYST